MIREQGGARRISRAARRRLALAPCAARGLAPWAGGPFGRVRILERKHMHGKPRAMAYHAINHRTVAPFVPA